MRFKLFMESADITSQAFRQWFGGSKVVDKKGNPLVVYHGTNAEFTTFKTDKQLGAHFGSIRSAKQRIAPNASVKKLLKVYLSLQNPFDIVSDLGDWDDMDMLTEYLGPGNYDIFTKDELKKMDTSSDVKKGLIAKGYDGIKYENRFEGKGTTSWVAFYPWQIKSIDNAGTWSKSSNNINEASDSFKSLVDYIIERSGWGSQEAEQEVQWYLDTIDSINKHGGTAYRLIRADSKEDINIKNLGGAFTLKPESLEDFEYTLERKGKHDYLVTVHVKPNGIDKKKSISFFKDLPYEYEVRLTSSPTVIDIQKVKFPRIESA